MPPNCSPKFPPPGRLRSPMTILGAAGCAAEYAAITSSTVRTRRSFPHRRHARFGERFRIGSHVTKSRPSAGSWTPRNKRPSQGSPTERDVRHSGWADSALPAAVATASTRTVVATTRPVIRLHIRARRCLDATRPHARAGRSLERAGLPLPPTAARDGARRRTRTNGQTAGSATRRRCRAASAARGSAARTASRSALPPECSRPIHRRASEAAGTRWSRPAAGAGRACARPWSPARRTVAARSGTPSRRRERPKFRLRSTPRAFTRAAVATPSGLRFATTQRSTLITGDACARRPRHSPARARVTPDAPDHEHAAVARRIAEADGSEGAAAG